MGTTNIISLFWKAANYEVSGGEPWGRRGNQGDKEMKLYPQDNGSHVFLNKCKSLKKD